MTKKQEQELKEMEEFFNDCNDSQWDGEVIPLEDLEIDD